MQGLCVVEGTSPSRPLGVDIYGMSPHLGQRLELRVVDASRNLRTRIVVDRLRSATFSLYLSNVLPVGRLLHTLEFYSDLDDNGFYSGIPAADVVGGDHSWIVELDWDDGYTNFTHNTKFDDLNKQALNPLGPDVYLNFPAFDAEGGLNLHAEVYLQETGGQGERLLGVYQVRPFSADGSMRVLQGVLDGNGSHRVDLVSDVDNNESYDPSVDRTWRKCFAAPALGSYDVTFDYDADRIADKSGNPECAVPVL